MSFTPYNPLFHLFVKVEGKTVSNLKLTLWVQGLVSNLLCMFSVQVLGATCP